ncbi:MAG: LPS export ABC transporter periplasmic protein LptC [Alphaproteobacteria bacterium]|nr:LPS export ABC transporter periplasmic protein LptC [Alphaproteobacteria bacterium]
MTDNITANRGQYNRTKKTITLTGNVNVDSSNGDRLRTDELVIRL